MWGPNINWFSRPSSLNASHYVPTSYYIPSGRGKSKRRKHNQQASAGPCRHIQIREHTDYTMKVRSLTVECPFEYPGLTEVERRKMYDGLAMIADAFRAADARCYKPEPRRRK